MYLEKKWDDFALEKSKDNYSKWKTWIAENDFKTNDIVTNPIEILITTDVLSEGQNLQDADMVINYDIHWNPVRVIQRFGRIDRIGSPNDNIRCINFWPAKSIDDYINLKKRVETRMAVMQFIGSEVIKDFTDDFTEMAENPMADKQNENLMRQMETSIDELDGTNSIGFDDFSFDVFKQQLFDVLTEKRNELENLPNGIFSGFKLENNSNLPPGIVALLEVSNNKNKLVKQQQLVYLDTNGKLISDNMKVILEILSENRHQDRCVPAAIDQGSAIEIEKLQHVLNTYINNQNSTTTTDKSTEVAGKTQLDVLSQLQKGSAQTIDAINENEVVFEKKFNLITWLIVS